jgi:hypothetical protein
MEVRIADFWDLAGLRAVARSNFNPLAIWFSNSTWVRRRLVVVQAWFVSFILEILKRERTYLGEGQAVLEVDVLSLNVTGDGGRVGITDTSDLEDDIGRGGSLDLEGDTVGWVVLDEEIGGGLAEILLVERWWRCKGGCEDSRRWG